MQCKRRAGSDGWSLRSDRWLMHECAACVAVGIEGVVSSTCLGRRRSIALVRARDRGGKREAIGDGAIDAHAAVVVPVVQRMMHGQILDGGL